MNSSSFVRKPLAALAMAVASLGAVFGESAQVFRRSFVPGDDYRLYQSGRHPVTVASRGYRRCNAAALKRASRKARNVRVCNGGRS